MILDTQTGQPEGILTEADIARAVADGKTSTTFGRVGRPREYADAVAFLASPVAGYITGTTLRIDGGWYGPA